MSATTVQPKGAAQQVEYWLRPLALALAGLALMFALANVLPLDEGDWATSLNSADVTSLQTRTVLMETRYAAALSMSQDGWVAQTGQPAVADPPRRSHPKSQPSR